jgi:hypothetical protein
MREMQTAKPPSFPSKRFRTENSKNPHPNKQGSKSNNRSSNTHTLIARLQLNECDANFGRICRRDPDPPQNI